MQPERGSRLPSGVGGCPTSHIIVKLAQPPRQRRHFARDQDRRTRWSRGDEACRRADAAAGCWRAAHGAEGSRRGPLGLEQEQAMQTARPTVNADAAKFVEQCHAALRKHTGGNPRPFLELWSDAPDVSLMGGV